MTRVALAALLVAAALPRVGAAYVRTYTTDGGMVGTYWDHRDLSWMLSIPSNGGEVAPGVTSGAALGAIETSFATWADVTCSQLSFSYLGSTRRIDIGFDPSASDNMNLFVFRTTGVCSDPSVVPPGDPCLSSSNPVACANIYNCWAHDTDIYALTTTTYNVDTGVLADSDTEFNAAPTLHRFTATAAGLPPCADPTDLTETGCIDVDVQNTATHEIGHYLGLAHTPVPTATMYATAALGETSKRQLAPDDIDGICAIYPIPPPSSGSSGCAGASASGVAVIAVALGLLRRRRGSRG